MDIINSTQLSYICGLSRKFNSKLDFIVFISKFSRYLFVTLLLLTILIPINAFAVLRLEGKININTATKNELMLLPEIGKVRSDLIVAYREERGAFNNVKSLVDVKGIGSKTLEIITPYIKLSGKSELEILDDAPHPLNRGKAHEFEEGSISLLGNENFYLDLIDSIKRAQKSIDISMFLFKTSSYSSNRANILLDALASASEKGVKVSLFLEKSDRTKDNVSFENKKSADKLLDRGVKVSFDSAGKLTHTKTAIIDGKISFIGSHNFTHSALKYNNELSVRIDSVPFAREVLAYIEGLN